MGKWFWDFSFWTLGYMIVQTAHCAVEQSLQELTGQSWSIAMQPTLLYHLTKSGSNSTETWALSKTVETV